jgi:plasmid maintenance system antidote protein VapI
MDYLAMPEQWRAIPGLEGYYDASTHGRIRSVRRMTASGWRGGKILKPTGRGSTRHPSDSGRLKVSISIQGKVTYYDVAVLVARAFLPPAQPGEQVRHGPAGLADNSPGNLSYGTPKQNHQDRHRDGTWPAGENNGNAKLTWEKIAEIRQRYRDGERQKDLAAEFGVTSSLIGHIIHGRVWVTGRASDDCHDGTGQHGERNPQAWLTWDIVREIRSRYRAGEQQKALAAEFEVTPAAITAVIRGRTWADASYTPPPDGRIKLTQEIADECRVRYANGETQAALAREFGVTDVMVSLIVRGKAWARPAGS